MCTLYFFIHLAVSGHLGYFHSLATLSNAAMNMKKQIALKDLEFNNFGYSPQNGIAGSHGHSIFNFLRKVHTVFLWLHPSAFSHQCTVLLGFPHPCQHYFYSHNNNPIGVWWWFTWFCFDLFHDRYAGYIFMYHWVKLSQWW